MSNPSRLTKLGLHGKKSTSNNESDTYFQTIEFPVDAVASGAAQDTGVKVPGTNQVLVSAILSVETAEATAAAKTLDVGLVGGTGSEYINDVSVAAAGWAGTSTTTQADTPTNSTANLSFTLAGADFVELEATCILTFQATG